MKKINLLIVLILLFTLNLSAFEGGGILRTGLGFDLTKDTQNLNHYDSLSLWGKQNLDKEGNYNFALQTSYIFNIGKPIKPAQKSYTTNLLNLDMFKFSFLIPIGKDSLSIDAGRYNIADITGVILNQNIDGVYLAYRMPKFSVFVNLGYTGLLNVYLNPTTAYNAKAISSKNTKLYKLAPSFFHLSALFQIPFASLRHSVDMDINSFISTGQPITGNNYASVSVNGPIVSSLFYRAAASLSALIRNKQKLRMGFYAAGELNYYFQKYGSKIGFKTQFFSGENNKFESFTLTNASRVRFIEYTDLWKTGLDFSIKPVQDLFLSTDLNLMTNTNSSKELLKGIEWTASATYTILQDIALSTDLGLFIDAKGNADTRVLLRGTISF